MANDFQENEAESHEATLQEPPPMPLWVKVFAGVALLLLLAFIVLHLTGNGMGNHFQSHSHSNDTARSR